MNHPYYSYRGHPSFPFYRTYFQHPPQIVPSQQYPWMSTQNGKSSLKNKNKSGKEYIKQDTDKLVDIGKQIEMIYNRLNQLEEENKQIKDELENKKMINVENVNYKIQDLHVEDLSGTLLVGLTSWGDAEELKELLAENGAVTINDVNTEEMNENMVNEESENGE